MQTCHDMSTCIAMGFHCSGLLIVFSGIAFALSPRSGCFLASCWQSIITWLSWGTPVPATFGGFGTTCRAAAGTSKANVHGHRINFECMICMTMYILSLHTYPMRSHFCLHTLDPTIKQNNRIWIPEFRCLTSHSWNVILHIQTCHIAKPDIMTFRTLIKLEESSWIFRACHFELYTKCYVWTCGY